MNKPSKPAKRGNQRVNMGGVVAPPAAQRLIPLRPITFSKLTEDAQKLLAYVPRDGIFIGNTSLQRKSKLGKRYWKHRDELVRGGFLTLGKGRGGSVARLAKAGAARTVSKKALFVEREFELYEPLRKWVAEEWGKGVTPGDFFEVLVTSSPRNRHRASGKWSRPDVTLVQVNSYDYLAQPVLDVTTFEVKKSSDAEDIRCIFEAAAHSRWAHFSYLVVEVDEGDYEFPERLGFRTGTLQHWPDFHVEEKRRVAV